MVRLEDMRIFAVVVAERSFTRAAEVLDLPKQTVSRRVAELESALGVRLLQRSTRRLVPTELGAAYAERCAEVARLADEANSLALGPPGGLLRVTADPLFGEAFLGDLIVEYAGLHPEVRVEVVLTRRPVDLVEEGFDAAFRVVPAPTGLPLGPAAIRYCASPLYLRTRGTPRVPADLSAHECVLLTSGLGSLTWPAVVEGRVQEVPVSGRLRFSSWNLVREACLAGLGLAVFPSFACAALVRQGLLVPVLEEFMPPAGALCLLHPPRRLMTARLRAFVELVKARFLPRAPWDVEA